MKAYGLENSEKWANMGFHPSAPTTAAIFHNIGSNMGTQHKNMRWLTSCKRTGGYMSWCNDVCNQMS